MRNSFKVAKWEVKRNVKNKTYIIGLFMTPMMLLVFAFISNFMSNSDDGEAATVDVYIDDQLEVMDSIQETVHNHGLNWEIHSTNLDLDSLEKKLESSENTAFLILTEEEVSQGTMSVYTSADMPSHFTNELQLLESPIQWRHAEELGLSTDQLEILTTPITFNEVSVDDMKTSADQLAANDHPIDQRLAKLVPGIFGGLILFSIVIAGMYIFQSASLEKKDKIAEIILSSVTPGDLMQGKIIGYFVLGLLQVGVILVFALPIAIWQLDFPVLRHLWVPESLMFIFIAVLGYLLYAALFVGIGATMTEVSSAGNFQGLVMMLPFLPLLLIGPVLNDPSGLVAKVGTYIPFTTPGILMFRLVLLEEWPWLEVSIAFIVLIVSIWLFMKLAGKIFKIGILMYGKNATPSEVWRWLRA